MMDNRILSSEVEKRDRSGNEIFEITPVILGGSATDPANKAILNREEHIKAVVYWNKIIKELRDKGASKSNRRD